MPESALRQVLPSSLDRIRSQEGQMLPAPAMQQESLRGAAFNTMYDMFGGSSEDPARRAQATRRAEGLLGAGRFAADITPVVGDAIAFGEARDAFRQGNMGQAAILGGLGTLGMVPVVGDAAAKVAKSLVKTDYRGSHQAPARDSGAPLNDLTMLIPEDVYSAAGPRLYGIGDPEVDRQAFSALRNVRGKPEAEVTVYRAVPENVSSINEGDWVTTSRKYADMHGENALGGNYKIIQQKAKAKDLYSEGYPYEFGYSPLDMSNRTTDAGSAINIQGVEIPIREPSDNINKVMKANFQFPSVVGNQTLNINDIYGGVRLDANEKRRVDNLSSKISGQDGFISRIIVDQNNNVIEGQHRLEALRQLGAKEVPVYKIEDLSSTLPIVKMENAINNAGTIHPDNVNQIMQYTSENIAEYGIDGARNFDFGNYQKYYDAALDAAATQR